MEHEEVSQQVRLLEQKGGSLKQGFVGTPLEKIQVQVQEPLDDFVCKT